MDIINAVLDVNNNDQTKIFRRMGGALRTTDLKDHVFFQEDFQENEVKESVEDTFQRSVTKIHKLGKGIISEEILVEFNNLIDAKIQPKIENLTSTIKVQAGMLSAMGNVIEKLVSKF